jgi:glycosyltransferase involved in cell wall biosynthesis
MFFQRIYLPEREDLRSMSEHNILELRAAEADGGGPEKTIIEGSAIAADRFKISVVYVSRDSELRSPIETRAKAKGLDFEQLRHRRALDWESYQRLCEIVERKHIHLVHCHDYKSNFLAYFLGRKFGLKTLSTAHGWTGNSWRERFLYYPLDFALLKRLDHIVAVSSEIERKLIKKGISHSSITMLPNGVDGCKFFNDGKDRARIRDSWDVHSDNFVIGSVGRLARQKRFDLLIMAFAKVFIERSNVALVIAGDGPELGNMSKVVRAAQTEVPSELRERFIASIRFLGSKPDIVPIYQGFDCFVQSSEYEGTPNVVLEAMAMKIPIVATNAGGTEDVLRNEIDGLIVETGSVSALQRAIMRVMAEDVAASERANQARVQVETRLDFRLRTRKLEAIYDRMLATDAKCSK